MEWIILGSMTVALLCPAILFLRGDPRLDEPPSSDDLKRRLPWPKVSLIIPVAGSHPGMADCLKSLLSQDYPDYEVLFVARDERDPAATTTAAVIAEADSTARSRNPRLLFAGPASHCGQKNQNILKGVEESDPNREALAFADSSHLAPPHWLKRLMEPIARGEAIVTTGYHHVIPGDDTIATLGRAVATLALYRLQETRPLTQPWGGATAILRGVFDDLGVKDIWAENVVDDVSLAALLKKDCIQVQPVARARLSTPLAGETFENWIQWLTRQWLYLKFCFPGTWVLTGVLTTLLPALILIAVIRCAGPLFGMGFSWGTVASAFFLAALLYIGDSFRRFHPSRISRPKWLAATIAAVFIAAWCHMKTWPAMQITWRGITYRVTWKGRVVEVRNG